VVEVLHLPHPQLGGLGLGNGLEHLYSIQQTESATGSPAIDFSCFTLHVCNFDRNHVREQQVKSTTPQQPQESALTPVVVAAKRTELQCDLHKPYTHSLTNTLSKKKNVLKEKKATEARGGATSYTGMAGKGP
jgi:hypothetical protein